MTRGEWQDCEVCDGDGVVEVRHSRYGNINCPDPTEEQTCYRCHGKGGWIVRVWVDDRQDGAA